MKLKESKGFTQVDLIIAIMIVMIFSSMIAALFVNLSNEQKRVERKSEATSIAVEVIEKIKQMDYKNVDSDKTDEEGNKLLTIDELNNLLTDGEKINIKQGYTVSIKILNYKDYKENESKNIEDILKKVTVTVTYTVGKSEERVTLETLISVTK